MARSEKEYEKLPGRGRPPFPRGFVGGGGTMHLYVAKDHLLKVERTYVVEKYRRFYFKDIQLLCITRNKRALWMNIVLLLFTLAGAALAWESAEPDQVAWAIVPGFFLVLLLANLIAGPTCSTRLETSIGSANLYSLKRWRKARKVVARLLPLIREAQGGEEDPASLARRLRENQPPPLSFVDLSARAKAEAAAPEAPGKSWMAFALAALLLAHAAASGLLLVFPGSWGFTTAIPLFLAAVILDILLLAQPVPGCPRALSGTILGWICLYGLFLYALLIQGAITQAASRVPRNSTNPLENYSALFDAGLQQTGFTIVLLCISAAASAILGMVLLVRLYAARRRPV